MALPTFAVTHSGVHDHYFPGWNVFGAGTVPTSTTVGEMVTAEAGRVFGALLNEGISAATISDDLGVTYPAAYAQCQSAIRLGAAIRVMQAVSGAGAVPEHWRTELEAFYKRLDELGYLALGDAPAPAQNSDGPRWHGQNHDLDTGDDTLLSSLEPKFRRDDEL